MNGTGKPTSEEVAEALRARIESGELAAGQPIPTQKSLVDVFGAESQAWFDALWDTIATDLALG
ncbi:GntR family transcriptional regulator [Streptomyces scopuliridis]|uniref:GntR family transcriptional regulator n=1 Tax=Streptomyces scopuliridis TaxID=452529 RepID=UPI003689F62F